MVRAYFFFFLWLSMPAGQSVVWSLPSSQPHETRDGELGHTYSDTARGLYIDEFLLGEPVNYDSQPSGGKMMMGGMGSPTILSSTISSNNKEIFIPSRTSNSEPTGVFFETNGKEKGSSGTKKSRYNHKWNTSSKESQMSKKGKKDKGGAYNKYYYASMKKSKEKGRYSYRGPSSSKSMSKKKGKDKGGFSAGSRIPIAKGNGATYTFKGGAGKGVFAKKYSAYYANFSRLNRSNPIVLYNVAPFGLYVQVNLKLPRMNGVRVVTTNKPVQVGGPCPEQISWITKKKIQRKAAVVVCQGSVALGVLYQSFVNTRKKNLPRNFLTTSVDPSGATVTNPFVKIIPFGFGTDLTKPFVLTLGGDFKYKVVDSRENGQLQPGDACPRGTLIRQDSTYPFANLAVATAEDILVIGCNSDGVVVAAVFLEYLDFNDTHPPTPAPVPDNRTDRPTFPPSTSLPTQTPTIRLTQTPATAVPTRSPTTTPTATPTSIPTTTPISAPATSSPTSSSVVGATSSPTRIPSSAPSLTPSSAPSVTPSAPPTATTSPTSSPVVGATSSPTRIPSSAPSLAPSSAPVAVPSTTPTGTPTDLTPSSSPSASPTLLATGSPSASPSQSAGPTGGLSELPSTLPSQLPSQLPSFLPSMLPSMIPSEEPTA